MSTSTKDLGMILIVMLLIPLLLLVGAVKLINAPKSEAAVINADTDPRAIQRIEATVKSKAEDFGNGQKEILVEKDGEETYLIIGEKQVYDIKQNKLVEDHKFKVGDKLTYFVEKNAPVMLSNPPKVNPIMVVVNAGSGEISAFDLDFYNEKGVGASGRIKINSLEGVKPIDTTTKKPKLNNYLFITYTDSTRSIPSQVVPEYALHIQKGSGMGDLVKDGMDLFLLRDHLELDGIKVGWVSAEKKITLDYKGRNMNVFPNESKIVYDNGDVEEISKITIEDGKTYASRDLFMLVDAYLLNI